MASDSDPAFGDDYTPGTSMVAVEERPIRLPALPWYEGPPQTPDILQGGLDPLWLWHSFRRRWVFAVGLGLIAAMLFALAVWALIPAKASATAVLKVDSVKPAVFKRVDEGESDFDTYRRTLAGMFKTEPVLNAALKLNGGEISKLPSLADVPELEKGNWLSDNLEVLFVDKAELMQIEMSGSYPGDLVTMVDGITKAFMKEVVEKERLHRMTNRDTLKRSYDKTMVEIEKRTRELYALSRELYAIAPQEGGADRSIAFKAYRSIATTDLDFLRRDIEGTKKELFQLELLLKLERAKRDDPILFGAAIDKLIAEDPTIMIYRQQLMSYDVLLSEELTRSKRADLPSLNRIREKRQAIGNQIAQREAELRPQIEQQMESSPNILFREVTQGAEVRKVALTARLAELEKQHEEKTNEFKRLEERSLDLDMMTAKLDELHKISRDMSSKIETLQIEIDLPDRVQVVQQAELRPGLNKFQRGVLIGFGGLFGFGLVAFGIAFWEFQSRRLHGSEQIDQGLGLRVLGELPSLAGQTGIDESDPRVAMLFEAVDSVRTTLIHMNEAKHAQVVMVTSAAESEGRTTVASLLAASLARAGRRTVLIDADTRNPGLHKLFGLPLENGVCELLRGEVDVLAAIRPTHDAGLWVLTAGQFDAASIQALGYNRIEPILARLRREFEFVIIDAAPVLSVADAPMIGQHVDGAILSVLRDVSQVPQVYEASQRLRRVRVPILGVVINGVQRPLHVRALRIGNGNGNGHAAPVGASDDASADAE